MFKSLPKLDKAAKAVSQEMTEVGANVYSSVGMDQNKTPLYAVILVCGEMTQDVIDAVEKVRAERDGMVRDFSKIRID